MDHLLDLCFIRVNAMSLQSRGEGIRLDCHHFGDGAACPCGIGNAYAGDGGVAFDAQ